MCPISLLPSIFPFLSIIGVPTSIFPASSLIIPGSADVLCRGCRGRWGCSLTWVSVVVPAILLSRLFWLRHRHPRRQDKISDGVGGNTSCCWLSQCSYSAVNVKSLKDPLVVVIWPQADYLNNLLSFALVTSHEEWDLSKREVAIRWTILSPWSAKCGLRWQRYSGVWWGFCRIQNLLWYLSILAELASFRLTRRFAV